MSTKKATEMIRYYKNPNGPTIGVTAKDVIESDGLYFKDLNGDGTLNTKTGEKLLQNVPKHLQRNFPPRKRSVCSSSIL